MESLYNTALSKVTSFIGKDYSVYFPLLYTTFY